MHITVSIICLVIVIGLLRSLYIRKRSRENCHKVWEDFCYTNDRYKIPIWLYLLSSILCFVPILNITNVLITVITCLICCYVSYTGSESWEKEEIRPYSKIFRAFRFLNKKI